MPSLEFCAVFLFLYVYAPFKEIGEVNQEVDFLVAVVIKRRVEPVELGTDFFIFRFIISGDDIVYRNVEYLCNFV